MQIILLEKVIKLGNLGDVVKVKDGYARNFLIPNGKAKRATADNLAAFEAKRAVLERVAAEKAIVRIAFQPQVRIPNPIDAEAGLTLDTRDVAGAIVASYRQRNVEWVVIPKSRDGQC